MERDTAWLDSQFSGIGDDEPFQTITIDRVIELTMRCHHDPAHGAQLWNHEALRAALDMQKQMKGNGAYLVLRRGRNLTQPRRESAGILTGGEEALAPRDAVTLFLYRQNRTAAGEAAVWWPQIRFPDGNYVLAFSFDW